MSGLYPYALFVLAVGALFAVFVLPVWWVAAKRRGLQLGRRESCSWTQDGDDSDSWATGCRRFFRLDDGTPSDNNMKFCCFCGRKLEQHPWSEDEDQDE